jgi:hypothetical protein
MYLKLGACLLLTLAIGVTSFGCGGDSETKASAPLLSKAQFVTRVSHLCTEKLLKAETKALKVFLGKSHLYKRHGDFSEFKGSLHRQEISIVLAPALHKRLEAVRQLGIPSDDKHQVETILNAIDQAAKTAEEDPFGYLESGAPLKQPRALARAYGIESCARLYRNHGPFQRASASPGVRLTPRSSK